MGFMDKVGATLAAKYGKVTEGKYQGFEVAFGNAPNKPVEAGKPFEQIIFLDGTEEKARLVIKDTIRQIHMNKQTDDGLDTSILWEDGETSHIFVEFQLKDANFGVTMFKRLLLVVKGGKSSNDPHAKEKEVLGRAKNFFFILFEKLNTPTLLWYGKFCKANHLFNEAEEKAYDDLMKMVQKQ